MRKILASVLTVAMLLGGAASVIADDAAPLADGLTLAEGSHLKITDGIIDMIDGAVTVADLKANFAGEVAITSPDGTAKADDNAVATDDIVKAGADSAKAIIWGDADRNGKVNLTDITAMMKVIAGWDTEIAENAADVDRDGDLKLNDVAKYLKHLAGWEDISLGNVRMVFENKKLTAENEAKDIDLLFTSTMLKVGRSETEISDGTYSYKIKTARNETESCQFFLINHGDYMEGLTAELTPFEHEFGDAALEGKILREFYYDLSLFPQINPLNYDSALSDYYAEAVLPNVTDFEVMENTSQGFMIDVEPGKDAPAGMYKATLNIKDADGKIIKTADVYAYVWDFTLPDAPYSKSAFGLNRGEIAGRGSSEEYATSEEQYTVYYEFLLEHNMTPSELPYDLLDERSDAYMSDPRVTSFRTMPELGGYAYTDFFGEGDVGDVGQANANWDPEATAEKLVATMKKVSSDPSWADKSYFTIMDEPYDLDAFNRIMNVDNWMKDLLGDVDFNLMLCMASNGVYSQEPFVDLVDFVQPIMDYWCPQSTAFTLLGDTTPGVSGWNTSSRSVRERGNFIDRVDGIMDGSDELWWYICCAPEIPYANYFNFYQGVANRVLLWQQYMFGVEGILYWDTTAYWGRFSKYQYGAYNGDGLLVYPGNFYGMDGVPIASFRMIQVRDSFDDYDYLAMAEEIAGADALIRSSQASPPLSSIIPRITGMWKLHAMLWQRSSRMPPSKPNEQKQPNRDGSAVLMRGSVDLDGNGVDHLLDHDEVFGMIAVGE